MSNIADAKQGDTISFQTKHSNDNVTYKGKIQGICGYAIAKNYGDIVGYHANVKKVDPSQGDLSTLTFLLIQLVDPKTDKPVLRVFATSWITEGSFTILDEASAITLKIYNIDGSDISDVIASLTARGYVVSQE